MRKILVVFVFVTATLGLAVRQPAAAVEDLSRYTAEEQANLAAAQACLDAFAAGDMDGFYAALADDVVWEINGSRDIVPSHGSWIGIDAVRAWVDQVNAELEFIDFGPDQYFVDGDTVIVICHERDHVPATGKLIDQREIGLFTFADGKVVKFLLFDDSGQEHWAMTPEA